MGSTSVLKELTGQEYGPYDWNEWMEWLGKHSEEYRPPEGYLGWKRNLLSGIDPRFSGFLPSGVKIDIDLTEVIWGGVAVDGIPDLQNPPMLSAEEVKEPRFPVGIRDESLEPYPLPDDRVFGVSINGDHRAYPLRVANPHELINDVVGGEPISLVY